MQARTGQRLRIHGRTVGAPDEEGEIIEDVDRGHVRLYVNRGQAAAFCERANDVIEAGRPTCRWCSNPIDPDGHLCPRMN